MDFSWKDFNLLMKTAAEKQGVANIALCYLHISK